MTVTVDGGSKLKEFLDLVAKQKARGDVGFFPEAKYKDGTQVAQVAIYQEFGTVSDDGKRHIPPRPFFLTTYNKNKIKWRDNLAKIVKAQGNKINVKKALETVCFIAQHDVQDKIDEWASIGQPRNADYTIEKKGFDSPLIETGHMRESVTFKVTTS